MRNAPLLALLLAVVLAVEAVAAAMPRQVHQPTSATRSPIAAPPLAELWRTRARITIPELGAILSHHRESPEHLARLMLHRLHTPVPELAAAATGGVRSEPPASERAALLRFFNQTNGGGWLAADGWDGKTPGLGVCDWLGITCDPANTTVTGIILPSNRLSADDLPDDTLSGLPNLQLLFLVGNMIDGRVPNFSASQHLAIIELSSNMFNGTIPPDFPASTTYVGLWRNRVSGTIPDFLGQLSLEYLLVNANNLTGSLPSFAAHTNLTQLNVHFNQLNGSLPDIVNHARLQIINIGPNLLTGTLPSFIGCHNLTVLSVERNNFTGGLPDYSHLTNLWLLDVSGSALTGSVRFAKPMPALFDLNVGYNQFSGSLQFMVDSIPAIGKLAISGNNWNGALPSPLPLTLPQTLETFIAVRCTLTGPIPTNYANLTNLQVLILRENFLTAPLPPFRTLQRLDLSSNPLNTDISTLLSPLWNPNVPITTGPTYPFETLPSQANTEPVYGPTVALQLLDVSNCGLTGQLPFDLWNPANGNLFMSLTDLSFAQNAIDGRVPTLSNDNIDQPMALRNLNLSSTLLYGPVPLRFENIPFLQSFYASNTSLRSNAGRTLPPWISVGSGATSEDYLDAGYACPNLVTQSATGLIGVATLDPAYYDFAYCKCISNFFGPDGSACTRCHGLNVDEHSQCVCQDRLLQNCYPAFSKTDPTKVIKVLPCPTVSGVASGNNAGTAQNSRTACNPNNVSLTADGRLPADGSWCATGHAGRLCSQCIDGYYRRGTECYECPTAGIRILATALQIVVLVCIFTYYYISSDLSSEKRDGKTDSAAMHILTFHAQLLGLLVTSQFALPASFSQLLSFSSNSSSFSITSLFAFECIADTNLPLTVQLVVALPAMLIALTICVYIASLGWPFIRAFCYTRGRASEAGDIAVRARFASVLIRLLNLAYFPVSTQIMSVLGCSDTRELDVSLTDPVTGAVTHVNGDTYLNVYSWQSCNTPEYTQQILPAAVVGCLFWVIGLPVAFAVSFWYIRDRLHDPTIRAIWGAIYGYYKPARFYWELIVLTRRLLLIMALTLIPYYSAYVGFVFFGVLQVAVLLQHFSKPYGYAADNTRELSSLYLLIVSYFSAVAANVSTVSSDAGWWFVILLISHLVFMSTLMYSVMNDFITRKKVCPCSEPKPDPLSESEANSAASAAAVDCRCDANGQRLSTVDRASYAPPKPLLPHTPAAPPAAGGGVASELEAVLPSSDERSPLRTNAHPPTVSALPSAAV